MIYWLVVSTHLKNISQNGNLPQVGDENKTYLKQPPSDLPWYKIKETFKQHLPKTLRIMGSQVTGGLEIQKNTAENKVKPLFFGGSNDS